MVSLALKNDVAPFSVVFWLHSRRIFCLALQSSLKLKKFLSVFTDLLLKSLQVTGGRD